MIIDQLERIRQLEVGLEDARRRGKRQSAPFSKGESGAVAKSPGRKSGKAHGRHGHRAAPAGRPDRELEAALPDRCPDCGGMVVCDRVDEQWQVDIPPVTPVVTKFNVAVGHCGGCGTRLQGGHPEQTSQALGAAASTVGPTARALGMWLHYGLGLSFDKACKLLDRFGIDLTRAAICQESASAASKELVPVHAELVAAANASASVVMDETGWHVEGDAAWMWVATNEGLTVYWVTPGRSFADATSVIGADYDGIIVRDGYVVYDGYSHATPQSCLAHLLRRCREMEADLTGRDRQVPLAARDLDVASRAAAAVELTSRVETLCARPPDCDDNRRLLAHLAHEAPGLFTFLTADPALHIDATNWRAETDIRPAAVLVYRRPHPRRHHQHPANRRTARPRRRRLHRRPGPSTRPRTHHPPRLTHAGPARANPHHNNQPAQFNPPLTR